MIKKMTYFFHGKRHYIDFPILDNLYQQAFASSFAFPFQLLAFAQSSLFSFLNRYALNTTAQPKMMAGIMIQNSVISIGDVFMEHRKNSNVQVVLLGIIMKTVVIGQTMLIVHVLRKQQSKQSMMMKLEMVVKKPIMIQQMKLTIDLLLLRNRKRKRKILEN